MTDKVRKNIDAHVRAVGELTDDHFSAIRAAADCIVESLCEGGKVLIAGNGGSAADAQHIAGEFIGRFLYDRRPLPAVALSTDSSVLTCVGNDYSFDDVFVRQVEALAGGRDVFWGLSTSGNSRNIVAAAEAAKKVGASVIGFTGPAGGKLASTADVCLAAPGVRTSIVQEIHMMAYHTICELVEEALCQR